MSGLSELTNILPHAGISPENAAVCFFSSNVSPRSAQNNVKHSSVHNSSLILTPIYVIIYDRKLYSRKENVLNTENNDIIQRESPDDESSFKESSDSSLTQDDSAEYNGAEADQTFSDDEGGNNEDDDEDDDIAAVAERITGARHSKVSTAAPIRIRENQTNSQSVPSPTAIPVRQNASGKNGPREVRMNHPGNPAFTQSMHIPHVQGSTQHTDRQTPAGQNGQVNIQKNHGNRQTEQARTTRQSGSRIMSRRTIIIAAAVLILLAASICAVSLSVKNSGKNTPENNVGTPGNIVLPAENDNQDSSPEKNNTGNPNGDPDDANAQPSGENDDQSDNTDNSDENGASENTPGTGDTAETPDEPDNTFEPEPTFTVVLSFYDREDITATVPKMTLSEIYDSVGYTPRATDRPSVPLDFVIAANTTVTIDTVEYKTETVTEVIPYDSEVIETDLIPRGTTNYITYGENGESARTYTVEYKNGVEQGRTLEYENVTKWAVNEEYEYGVGGSFVGSDGITYTYSYRRTVPATYYSIEGLTYLGTQADESVVAVDPDYIPLGTRLYVKNANYDFGARVAADVGPKVEDWEVDIWISPSNPLLSSFASIGYHYDMEIYYID